MLAGQFVEASTRRLTYTLSTPNFTWESAPLCPREYTRTTQQNAERREKSQSQMAEPKSKSEHHFTFDSACCLGNDFGQAGGGALTA